MCAARMVETVSTVMGVAPSPPLETLIHDYKVAWEHDPES